MDLEHCLIYLGGGVRGGYCACSGLILRWQSRWKELSSAALWRRPQLGCCIQGSVLSAPIWRRSCWKSSWVLWNPPGWSAWIGRPAKSVRMSCQLRSMKAGWPGVAARLVSVGRPGSLGSILRSGEHLDSKAWTSSIVLYTWEAESEGESQNHPSRSSNKSNSLQAVLEAELQNSWSCSKDSWLQRRKGPFVQVEPKNRSSWWAPCGCCPSKKRRDGEVCEASVLSSSCLLSSAQPGPGLGSPVSQAALGSRSCSPPNGLFSCQVPPAHRQQPGLPPHRQHRSQEAVPHGGHGLLLHHVLCLGLPCLRRPWAHLPLFHEVRSPAILQHLWNRFIYVGFTNSSGRV